MDHAKLAREAAPWLDFDEDLQLASAPSLRLEAWRERRERELAEAHALLVLRHEIATCMIFVAAAAAAANFGMAERGREARAIEEARHIMPTEPQGVSSALGALGRAGVPMGFVTAVMDFVVRVRLARQACTFLTSEPNVEGRLVDLADQLSRLCLEGVDVLRGFDDQIVRLGVSADGVAPAGAISAERLAFAAGHGGWPCVDEQGRVEIPTWVENRRHARRRTEATCEMAWGDRQVAATIVDVSAVGAGLTGVSDIAVGTLVNLVLGPGEEIEAEVMWQSGNRCGVRFTAPLAPDRLSALQGG